MDSSIEQKWQMKWKEAHLFEPRKDDRKQKFLITVPWPYTNGSLHVGHGRTYTTADIIARYKRITGYNVLFPMAFHQSGTPILAFSEKIRLGDKKTIAQYRDNISEYEPSDQIDRWMEEFKKPEKIAAYFSDRIVKDFEALGYSIDWTRRFTSADPFYKNFVETQFRKLKSLGLIKKGQYPILYSVNDANAVGEDDIADGDIDKVTIEEFTGVVFNGPEYSLIAASLRPETLYGVTNLWVSPAGKYVIFSMDGKRYAISEEGFEKLGNQRKSIEIVRKITTGELINGKFKTPLDGREIPVFKSDFVDPDNGTGIVYSVPGHAVWDYVAIAESDLPIASIKILEIKGPVKSTVESLIAEMGIKSLKDTDKLKEATQQLYKAEFYDGFLNEANGSFSGLSVQDAREAIKKELFKNAQGFIFYETSRKAQTRGGSKVVVAILDDQWFIDYSVDWWKKASHELVNQMFFYPEFYRNAMNDAVDWLRERPCARRRGIGTQLPFNREWIIESLSDSTIYPAVYTNVLLLREIYEELGQIPDEVNEYIYFGGPESGLNDLPEKVKQYAREARLQKDYWYGVDIRLTAAPHLSNHLSFYVMNHVALFKPRDQPKGIIISGLVNSYGAKISKSKGNAISLLKISTKYSADLYRLFIAVAADISSLMDWNETDLAAVKRKYESFLELINITEEKSRAGNEQAEKWFVSKFNSRMKDYVQKMDSFDIRGAYISIFYEVMNDLKYVENRGGSIYRCVESVREEWLKSLVPVIPHTCEEIWANLGHGDFISASEIDKDKIGAVDEYVLLSEEYIQSMVQDIREIIKATGITPSKLELEVCGSSVRKAAESMAESRTKDVDPALKSLIPEFMKNKRNMNFSVPSEAEILKNNSSYLGSLFRCDVSVKEAGIYPGKKNAWPGRPLIRLS